MLEAGVALVVFLLGQLCTLVWMLASIFTQLKNINDTLEKLEQNSSQFITKAEVAMQFGFRDSKIEAAWKAIDGIKTVCGQRESSVAQVAFNTKRIDDIEKRLNHNV